MVLPSGTNIARFESAWQHGEFVESTPNFDHTVFCPALRRVREWHAGCDRTATRIARDLTEAYTKGMSLADQTRHSQALAYLAYRTDGQSVALAELAAEIRVPEERLSKDVKAIEAQLGTRGFEFEVDGAVEFSAAVLSLVHGGVVKAGTKIQEVTRWCKSLYCRAARSQDVAFDNLAPKHQAAAAVALYCKHRGSPFLPPAEAVERGLDTLDEAKILKMTIASIARLPTSKRAMALLAKHLESEGGA